MTCPTTPHPSGMPGAKNENEVQYCQIVCIYAIRK